MDLDLDLDFKEISYEFHNQLESIGPFGMKNPKPLFWTRKCRILEIYKLKDNHIKLKLKHDSIILDAIKWNNVDILNVNNIIDIAYYLEINNWKSKNKLQLNLIATKNFEDDIEISLHNRIYKCSLLNNENIKITNEKGEFITSNHLEYSKTNDSYQRFTNQLFSLARIALGISK